MNYYIASLKENFKRSTRHAMHTNAAELKALFVLVDYSEMLREAH